MLRTRRFRSSATLAALLVVATLNAAAPLERAAADTTDGTLTVVVDRDVDADGNYDAAVDTPQPGITVTVTDSAGASVSGTTGDDGTYSLEPTDQLSGGHYFVEASIPADLADLSPVPQSDSFVALSTTVDVSTDAQTVRMGVVQKATEVEPTSEPEPTATTEPPPVAQSPDPRFAIGDYVWHDLDRSGTQNAEETPASRISVQLLDGNGAVLRSTLTHLDGHYWFDRLPAGTYAVRFAGLPSGSRLTTAGVGSNTQDSDPDASGTTPPITLAVGAPGVRPTTPADGLAADYVNPTVDAGIAPLRFAVGDHVWSDLNNDGVQSDVEPPARATVTLLDDHGVTLATTATDDAGHYEFTGLAAGRYRVRFTDLPANRAFTIPGAGSDSGRDSDVDPSNGLTPVFTLGQRAADLEPVADPAADYLKTGVDAGLIGSYSIGDTVWHDVNGDGVLEPGDAGVKGVTVELLSPESHVINTTKTSRTGRYTFGRLPAGDYRVRISRLRDGMVPTLEGQGDDRSVDSDVDASGFSPVISLGDDNPADTTVDAGVTTSAAVQASAAGDSGTANVTDTALSSTGGVDPALPLGGVGLVTAGAACLAVDRRRRG